MWIVKINKEGVLYYKSNQPSNFDELLDELQSKNNIYSISNILAMGNLIFGVYALWKLFASIFFHDSWNQFFILIMLVTGIAFCTWLVDEYIDKKSKTLIVEYQVDEQIDSVFNKFKESLIPIQKEHVTNGFISINQNVLFDRYFKSNKSLVNLVNGNKKLCFLMDNIILKTGSNISYIQPQSIQISFGTRIVRERFKPSSSKAYTPVWKYSRIDGGPDRRYRNNSIKAYNVCYDTIMFDMESYKGEKINIIAYVSCSIDKNVIVTIFGQYKSLLINMHKNA